MKQGTRVALSWRAFLLALLAALLSFGSPAPVGAEPQPSGYVPVVLDAAGHAPEEQLAGLSEALRPRVGTGAQVVVLVHGFGTRMREAEQDYSRLASRLSEEAAGLDLPLAIVGVHWPSSPGSIPGWLPQALGNRITSLLGFKKAIKNPYLEKAKLAQRAGEDGLRQVLLRIQADFPGTPVHLLTHSLGSAVAVAALSSESTESAESTRSTLPTLSLGLVALAGADLDRDVFCRQESAREALDAVRVWWVTAPEAGKADGVLELRRGAGRSDAVGNGGLCLLRADRDRLLRRRGLVLEQGNVPVWHQIGDYYNAKRLRALATAMLYLQRPDAEAAAGSVLAALDRVLGAAPAELGTYSHDRDASVRLYAGWRQDPASQPRGLVAIARPSREMDRVAGSRQEKRN